MGVTKKAIYPKSASQICYKESNFIFASSCFGKKSLKEYYSKTFKLYQKYDKKSLLSNNDI